MNISIDDMAKELAAGLQEYSQEVADGIKSLSDELAEKGVAELKSTSPERTGRYKKGWTRTTRYESKSAKRNEIHNKTAYQLTHLLEKGHVGRNGQRVRAIEHIQPVEEELKTEFETRVMELLGK